MILYQTLEKTDAETLYRAFLEVFSDYTVPMDLSFSQFRQMLQSRGYTPEISVGAFEKEKLVGFVFNGLRGWNGKTTAYDLGTGVAAVYRRQGITSEIISHAKKQFAEKSVEQYLLEVIQSNESAVRLYTRQGFQVCRELTCYMLDRNRFWETSACKVENVGVVDLEPLAGFWDFLPSWQNSIASVNAVPSAFQYVIVRDGDRIVGYGMIDKVTGDIPQLAVDPAYRGKGIGTGILAALIGYTESRAIRVLNVQAGSKSFESFLTRAGFEPYVRQFEMLLEL